jgi:3-oxoacyl-[acyl-carrier protein] reductase
MFELAKKVAIVTGAARGIGRSIALQLARKGASVIIADLLIEEAEKVTVEIRKIGSQSLALQVDVTQTEMVREKFGEAIEKFGKIDILVNNAGVLQDAFITDIKEEDWDRVIDINLKGVFNCCIAS